LTRLSIELKEKAKQLRRKGFSLTEISVKLSISKSTLSDWLKNIALNRKALERLKDRKIYGQYKSRTIKLEKGKIFRKEIDSKTKKIVDKLSLDQDHAKILCSLIYYCEGVKGTDRLVTFINSDPSLVSLFLTLFRKGFDTKNSKFRILMHLHNYHNEQSQKLFWSKITKISQNQFQKTYFKPNTGKRQRDNYPGCVSIRYYDAIIAKELLSLYRSSVEKIIDTGV